jgi:hypothetical protein
MNANQNQVKDLHIKEQTIANYLWKVKCPSLRLQRALNLRRQAIIDYHCHPRAEQLQN